uniref:Uncharacterized protein n=2 Tax=Knipowitschia caucasica TaxID=637954 RepID=A0AAV2LXH3_KNICA
MTCLGCRVSYCERHRSGHMVEHWTVEPGIDLKKNVCHVHHRTVSLYCNTDRQLVCPVCAEKLHTGHQIISAEEEMVRRKAVMVAEQQNVETLLQKHKRTRGKIQQKIKKMITDSTVDFSNRAPEYFILCRALLNNAGVALTWFLQQVQVNNKRKAQLEQEVGDVTERLSELDSLSQIKDLVRFKKVYKAFCQEKPKTYPEIPTLYTVKELTDLMRDVSEKLSKTKNLPLSISLSPVLYYQPITREQFMRCYVDIQLDPDTAHPCLLLSEDGRKVTVVKKPQKYPDHPKRFSHARQALAKLLLLHSYFEAVWEKEPKILGFADQRIHRKGEGQECVLGMNSWSCFLRMDSSKTTLWHNKEEVTIETSHKVNRVGVFVDTLAASMSFYDVDDGMRLLAMIQTNFAEVFVAVGFPDETPNSVEFVKPN